MNIFNDYPETLLELEEQFAKESDCLEYLSKIRWPDGFVCPRCNSSESWMNNRGLYVCKACDLQTSITSGTIFHQTRKPLRLWLNAMWHISNQKYGANALGLQRTLGLGSYNTAWQWLHKLRRAMVRPNRENLSGTVEVDETFIGGSKSGKRGRGAEGKAIIAVAVEDKGKAGIGRIRLKYIDDASGDSLNAFLKEVVSENSTIRTDRWNGYNGVEKAGYSRVIEESHGMIHVHLVISLLKRWLLGTYQGAVRPSHLPYYLDEFTFRFNRRTSKSRGKLFYRLVQQALFVDPAPVSTLRNGSIDLQSEGENKANHKI
jgi:transposase-like protein